MGIVWHVEQPQTAPSFSQSFRIACSTIDAALPMAMICPRFVAPVAEPVDAADSKSVACEGVPVRVRPGAPSVR